MSNHRSIFWHDYETWGAEPRKDRPCQFAGIRTDEDLNIIDEPVEFFCQPTPDYLPHPEACLVTGISPQQALDQGLSEADFSARITEQFMQPATCVAGYNSIRFDDEVTRHLLYRCFYDPYEREWKNGNSRWDIIDLVRMTHALRPEGIQWPQKEDGSPSFRLEELTAANNIDHEGAHDALVDVRATIAMAKLVKQQQPRLYDWYYQLRNKNKVKPLLDLNKQDMLLHISGMIPASRGCLAVIMPLLLHPVNANGVVVVDLAQDPASWLDLEVDEIRRLLFTPTAELAEGEQRIALKTVHINKCPALAPMAVLGACTVQKYGIDLATCKRHRQILLNNTSLAAKLREVFTEADLAPVTDPDHMLYSGGFFSDQDRDQMALVRTAQAEQLPTMTFRFQDARLPEMLFRYRARNFPGTLDATESARWRNWCAEQLQHNPNGVGLTASDYFTRLSALKEAHPDRAGLLDELQQYGERVCQLVGVAL